MNNYIEMLIEFISPTKFLPRAGSGGADKGGLVFYINDDKSESDPSVINNLLGPSNSDDDVNSNVVLIKDMNSSYAQTKHDQKVRAVIIDCRAVDSLVKVNSILHTAGQYATKNLAKGGRVIIIASSSSSSFVSTKTDLATLPESDLIPQICEGFMRSLAKEIGPSSQSTCNLIIEHLPSQLTQNILGPVPSLNFFLSGSSSFITSQRVDVDLVATESAVQSLPLKGKLAVVTGAARGIGFETARTLALSGCEILMVDHPSALKILDESVDKIVKELSNHSSLKDLAIRSMAADVTDPTCGVQMITALQSNDMLNNNRKLNIMVHAAGITKDKTLKRMDFATYSQVMDVNLASVLSIDTTMLSQNIYNPQNASIILLASTSGIGGNVGQSNYSASKSGLMGYAQSRALKNKNMSWNCIAPGFIESDMTKNLPLVNRFAAKRVLSPLGNSGLPLDVAGAVKFLVGRGGGGVRGRCLRVCGGMMMGR